MEEALQKRIKIKGKKEECSEEVETCVMAAHIFLKFTMFLLSAGSLAIRGLFNNIKKYEENER